MELRELLSKIPSSISKMFEIIYCVKNETTYIVEYDGNNLRIKSLIQSEKLPDYVKSAIKSDETRKLINSKFLYLVNIEEYKLVFVCNLELENENREYSLLIADDSEVITNFFKKLFSSKFNIIVAKNGDEAIRLIDENKKGNLIGVFIDLQMPIKNGYEVLEYLKDNNLFKTIPVSVISGEDSLDGINRVTEYDVVDMLQKPFSAANAQSIVEKTISFSSKYKA